MKMLKLAKFLSWSFAIGSLTLVGIFLSLLQGALPSAPAVRDRAILDSMLLAMATVFGMAWWTARKGKASARGWAIAASLGCLILGILPVILLRGLKLTFLLTFFWTGPVWIVVMGAAGLVVFSRRDAFPMIAADTAK